MALSNRASIYNKIYKVLKKHYKPVGSSSGHPVLEHMLYACCLEDSTFEKADAAFELVRDSFFGWNEVRVTTVAELSEVMNGLYDPPAAATRLRRVLQNVFESCYSFEIEALRKQNIGQAVKLLGKYGGSPFAVAYVTQHALGGHSIPKDKGALQALYIAGAITSAESDACQAPGLERTIPKNKGVEFASLLHQLAADLTKTPHAPAIRAIFLEMASDAKDRLPKRRKKVKPAPKAAKKTAKKADPKKSSTKKTTKKTKATAKTKAVAKKKKVAKSKAVAKPKAAAKKKKKTTTKKKTSSSRSLTKRKPK